MSNEFWEIAAAPICLIVAGLVVYVCIDMWGACLAAQAHAAAEVEAVEAGRAA